MKKRLSLMASVATFALLLSACGEDNKTACKVGEYQDVCASETSYKTCVSGKIETKPCAEGQLCSEGACKVKDDKLNSTEEGSKCNAEFKTQCVGQKLAVCEAELVKHKDCEWGCDAQKNACKAKLHDSVGQACDKSYQGKCDGKISLNCVQGKVAAEECEANRVCSAFLKQSACLKTCTNEGEEKSAVCTEENGEAYVSVEICKKDDAGQLVEQPEHERCDNGCAANKPECRQVHEDEGRNCDKTYQERCMDNIVLYCDEEMVRALDCSYGFKVEHFCKMRPSAPTSADCASLCETPFAARKVCLSDEEGAIVVEESCETIGDKNYHFYFGNPEECLNGCNADYTACK